MRTVKGVLIPILLSSTSVVATATVTSTEVYCHTHTVSMKQSEWVRGGLDFSSLPQGSVLKICTNDSGSSSVFLAEELEANSDACIFRSRQIFEDDQEGWSFQSPTGSDNAQSVARLYVATAADQCPTPFSSEYVETDNVSPGVVIQFVEYWDRVTRSIQLYEELASSLAARTGKRPYLPSLQASISDTRNALVKPRIVYIAYDHGSKHSPPGYIAMARGNLDSWAIIFDLNGSGKVLVYSIFRVSE